MTDRIAARWLVRFAAAVLLVGALAGCEQLTRLARSDTGKAVICGGGGLVTGGATYFVCDALGGKKTTCTLTAVAAALADGFVCWWQLSEKIVEDYDLTAETLSYDPKQGTVLKILAFEAEPRIVHPGEQVKIRISYALMSPNASDEIQYQRNLTVPGEDKPRTVVLTHQPGTWGTEGDYDYTVGSNSPEGKIEMALEIKLPNGTVGDRRNVCFNIVHRGQPDPSQLCPVAANGQMPLHHAEVFSVSKVKKQAIICREPDNRCKSAKSKKYLATVQRGAELPLLGERRQGPALWYKIQMQNGEEGWVRAINGVVLEK